MLACLTQLTSFSYETAGLKDGVPCAGSQVLRADVILLRLTEGV
jgi:hypothetical protein